MPSQPPRFRPANAPTRVAWARPVPQVDRRLRGRLGQRLRDQVRREEPFCRVCLKRELHVATDEVDHIVPLAAGGGNERGNMQGLCTPCHEAKSKAERAAARRPGRPA